MPGNTFLEGERVELKTVEREDLEFLREGINHSEVRIHVGNRRPQNLENIEEFFEEQVCDDGSVDLLICKEEAMGIITLEKGELEKVGRLGIWIHPKFHGKGYGPEAVELLVEHAFNQLNYHKVWARAHDNNQKSKRLWEKLGFEQEGKLREHTYLEGEYKDVPYYGLLRSEWQ